MKPVIGITTTTGKADSGYKAILALQAYVRAVTDAGASPLLIPSSCLVEDVDNIIGRMDGILLTGGGDIAVERFNGNYHPLVSGQDPERDALEISMVRKVADFGKPFLGICRGCQVINVALGGTLYTHIREQKEGSIKHDYYPDYPRTYLAHEVTLKVDSPLEKIVLGPQIQVNSLHHQGINTLASSLEALAVAPDRLVEGVYLPGHVFGFAVQWHPEWLTDRIESRNLFKTFVDAAGKNSGLA